MRKTIENEDIFEDFSCGELFEYCLDHLIIPPDSEFDYWRHYKIDMRNMAKDFYERNIEI